MESGHIVESSSSSLFFFKTVFYQIRGYKNNIGQLVDVLLLLFSSNCPLQDMGRKIKCIVINH